MGTRGNVKERPGFFLCHWTNPWHLVKFINRLERTMFLAPLDDSPGRFLTDPGQHNIFYPGTPVQIDMVADRLSKRLIRLETTPGGPRQGPSPDGHTEAGKQHEP